MKRHCCKLDNTNNIIVELIKTDSGRTIISVLDKTHKPNQMPYKDFCQIFTEVDKYRLLQLSEFMYNYCQGVDK